MSSGGASLNGPLKLLITGLPKAASPSGSASASAWKPNYA